MAKDIYGKDIDDKDLDTFESKDDGETKSVEIPEEDPVKKAIDDLEATEKVELELEEEPHLSWKEKKKQRWIDHTARTKEAEEKRLQEQQARMEAERRAELAEQRARMLEMQYQQRQGAEETTSESDELYDAQLRIVEAYQAKMSNGTVTPEETNAYRRELRKINDKLIESKVKQCVKSTPTQDVGEAALQAQLRMQYPEVFSSDKARRFAQGLFMQHLALGHSNSLETMHKVLNQTNKQFRFVDNIEPDEPTKRRFTGMSGGNNAKSEDGKTKITITRDIVKMANAMYPNLKTEAERVKQWISVNGREYAELEKNK